MRKNKKKKINRKHFKKLIELGVVALLTFFVGWFYSTDIIFSQTSSTYSISGKVTYNGAGLAGVTMTLEGDATGTTTTDNNGNYTFSNLINGSYGIRPSKSGYFFKPSNAGISIADANRTDLNFTASLPSPHSISGKVTYNGDGLAEVTMTLSGDSNGTTTTDNNGNYTFSNLINGSYGITPSKSGYDFYPNTAGIFMSNFDKTDINFNATVVTDTVPPAAPQGLIVQ